MAGFAPRTPAQQKSAGAAVVLLFAAFSGAIMALWSNFFHRPGDSPPSNGGNRAEVSGALEDRYAADRERMVQSQLRGRDIVDPDVLKAMARVPRELLVPKSLRSRAYRDHPLPIGLGQTISQPYIVALMTQLAGVDRHSRVLEVGTGSGYQAAVLGELCRQVYSVEIHQQLADRARSRLQALGYQNISIRCGDGYQGWPEHAPFNAILVTAAPGHVPQPLIDQLAPGGRLVIPVGEHYQQLILIEKRSDGTLARQSVAPVQFVPMTGEAQQQGFSAEGVEDGPQ